MLRPFEGLLSIAVSGGARRKVEVQHAKAEIRKLRQGVIARSAAPHSHATLSRVLAHVRITYLGGDGIFCSGVVLLKSTLLPLLCVGGLFDAADASEDKAGSWIDEWLPCRCCVYEATVELEDGRDRSWLMDGNCLSSTIAGGVLRAGKSKTCSIDGLRKQSAA
jgi:hypothetical protein